MIFPVRLPVRLPVGPLDALEAMERFRVGLWASLDGPVGLEVFGLALNRALMLLALALLAANLVAWRININSIARWHRLKLE